MDYEYVNALKETYEKLIGKEGSKKTATSHSQYLNGSHLPSGKREPIRNGFPDVVRNRSKIRPVDPANLRAIQGLQARCANLRTSPPQKPEGGNKKISHTDSKELYNNDRNKPPPRLGNLDTRPLDGIKNKESVAKPQSEPKVEKAKNSPQLVNGGAADVSSSSPSQSKVKIDLLEYKKRKTEGVESQSRKKDAKTLPPKEVVNSYNGHKVIDFSASATASSDKVTEYLNKKKNKSSHQSSNMVIDFGTARHDSKKPKSKTSHESHSNKSSKVSETTIDFKASPKLKERSKKERLKEKALDSSSLSSSSSKDRKQHSDKMEQQQRRKEHSSEKKHRSEKTKEEVKKPPSCGNKVIDFEGPSSSPEKLQKQKEPPGEREEKRTKCSSQGNKIIDFDEKHEPKIKSDDRKLKACDPGKKKLKSYSPNEGSNKVVDFNDSPKTQHSKPSEKVLEKPVIKHSSSLSSKGGNQIVDFECVPEKKRKRHREPSEPYHKDKNLCKAKEDHHSREKTSSKMDVVSNKEHKKRSEDNSDKTKNPAKRKKSKEQVQLKSPQNFDLKKKLSKTSLEESIKEKKLNSPASLPFKPKSSSLSKMAVGKQSPKSESPKIPSIPKGNIPNGALSGLDKAGAVARRKLSPDSGQDKLAARPNLKRKSDEMPAFVKAAKLKRTESPVNGLLKPPSADPIKPAILPIRSFPGLVKTLRPPAKLHPLHRDYKKFQELNAAIPQTTAPKVSIPEKSSPHKVASDKTSSSAKKVVGVDRTKPSNQSKAVPSKGAKKIKIDFPENHAFLEELNGNPDTKKDDQGEKDPKSTLKVPEALSRGQNPARPLGLGGRKGPGHIRNLENKPPPPGKNKEAPEYVPTPKSRLSDKPGVEYDPMERGKCFNPGSLKNSQVEYVPTKISELRGLRETSNLPNRGPREEPYCPMPVKGFPENRRIPEYYPSNKRPPKLPPIGTYYKKLKRKRIESSDEEEYDEEMADFIDDEPVEGVDADYSSLINGVLKEVFNYDKTRFIGVDDNDDKAMESSFFQQMKEERRSARIGLLEDLEDMRLEEEEKVKEAEKKKRGAAGGKKQGKSYGNAFIF